MRVCSILCATLLLCGVARADVVPPGCSSTDTAAQLCTGKQAGDPCTFSNGTHGNCAALRCTTDGGAAVLSCVATGASPSSGCSALPLGAAGSSAGAVALLSAAAALLRRRRRRG